MDALKAELQSALQTVSTCLVLLSVSCFRQTDK